MKSATFFLDRQSRETLQAQLRQQIIEAILAGALPPGDRMPPSRRLAADLGIARNTVAYAYEQLRADGYLLGRERSGIYVSDALVETVRIARGRTPTPAARRSVLRKHIKRRSLSAPEPSVPLNWELNPHPFLDGVYDASLSARADLRDAVRHAFATRELDDWQRAGSESDDARLVHEIRTKALPRRGIRANSDEILVTSGAREAFNLISHLFVARGTRVAVEEPGMPELVALLRLYGAELQFRPVDRDGVTIALDTDAAELSFVTPGCQYPTSVRMSDGRRRALLEQAERTGGLIVEFDLPASGGFADKTEPALQSMDGEGRVIYVASLCDALSPGFHIGMIVADADTIRDLRRIQALIGSAPSRATQRIVSFFLSLGHQDALLVRQQRVLRARLNALRDALNYILPHVVAIDPVYNGSTMWVEGPADVSAAQLSVEAAKRGVLIEPGDRFYSNGTRATNYFRIGVTGVAEEQIREGITLLADAMRQLISPQLDRLDPKTHGWMAGADVVAAISGKRMISRTAYGDPYEIDVLADGTLIGRAGYEHEDCDTGRWWMEGDYWCRQWNSWAYGEAGRFLYTLSGSQVKWYRPDLVLFNNLVLTPLPDGEAAKGHEPPPPL
ncbi:MAG: PLP-dependent aminotransferase family protein [Sphingomonas sp.]|jgi:GntR family transcriptional regulator/MocR family aminotransferase|uniref:aminotransferase-like domain-containing protein n=1 Tax=Sphingomonas sp. TaxID=28214 RepID=UPI003564DCA0